MKSLWNDTEAQAFSNDRLELRVYTSRLLGANPDLVLHGGGNTSVKLNQQNFFGDPEELLLVKGSGWDLATIESPGFAPVRLDTLKRLAELETLSDTEMVRQQRAAMTDPGAPNPSVEAILHALIPFRYVDHTHADAVLAVTNHPDGEKSVQEILSEINLEDSTIANSVKNCLPQINDLISKAVELVISKGRIFYIGSGTSGRLGIVDASECLPTFGIGDKIIGIIAGGDKAIRISQEFAEDSTSTAWLDLTKHNVSKSDMVIGISASGSTPYVIGGLEMSKKNKITTGCITCNLQTKIAENSDFPVEVIVGPEYVTGSSRMKAGTAQKMILNMISTTVMIKLGRIYDNKMIDMKLSNNKLYERAVRILKTILDIETETAKKLIEEHKNIRTAIENFKK